ncbi:MAG: metallophosphoesterase [Fimbriiglobus sp.]
MPRLLFALAVAAVPAPGMAQNLPADARPTPFPAALAHKPTPLPDRVVLTWPADPATCHAVTWRTDATVETAVAQLAVAEDGPQFAQPGPASLTGGRPKVRTVPAVTNPLTTDLGDARNHMARFDGLAPNTPYVYRVGDGVNWSEWFQFRTPHAGPAPLRFLYFGDAQNDIKEHWSRVARGAFSDMPKAHFLLHAGDLVNRADSDAEWGEWFAAAGWIHGTVPCVPTPGNHEYSGPPKSLLGATTGKPAAKSGLTPHWRAQFALPEHGPPGLEETTFYFDIHGVRVVSLNSNERLEEQVPWLDRVLGANPHRWAVVAFHHPVYSTAKGRDNKKLRELWRPVLDRHGVDLVLQGHDHTYGRSGLMAEDNLLTGTSTHDARNKGTVYVVSVSGPKMYSLDSEPWMAASAAGKQLYQLVTIDGDVLHYEARTATGDVYDAFELRKRPDGRNDLVERSQLTAAPPVERSAESERLIGAVLVTVGLAGGYGLLRAARRLIR